MCRSDKRQFKQFCCVLALSLALFLLMQLCGCVTSPSGGGIPNLAQVSPGVYRSGQPTTIAQWQQLVSLGVSNVVKLNTEAESTDDLAKSLGMAVHYLPISTWDQIVAGPDATLLSNAVLFITKGTVVHCQHGQDRTGLTVALYRVTQCGWTKQQAEQEMLAHGFHKALRGLWEFWEDDKWKAGLQP